MGEPSCASRPHPLGQASLPPPPPPGQPLLGRPASPFSHPPHSPPPPRASSPVISSGQIVPGLGSLSTASSDLLVHKERSRPPPEALGPTSHLRRPEAHPCPPTHPQPRRVWPGQTGAGQMIPKESEQAGDHRESSPGLGVINPKPREQTAFGRCRCSRGLCIRVSACLRESTARNPHDVWESGLRITGYRPLSPPRPGGGAGPTRGRILRKHISRLCSILPAFHRNSDRKATVIHSLQKTIA